MVKADKIDKLSIDIQGNKVDIWGDILSDFLVETVTCSASDPYPKHDYWDYSYSTSLKLYPSVTYTYDTETMSSSPSGKVNTFVGEVNGGYGKMSNIVLTKGWSEVPLRLDGNRVSARIVPVGTIPLVTNGGIAVPIAKKIFAPAAARSIDLLSSFQNGELAELIGTSVKYADILKPRLLEALHRMLEATGHEIAPGIYRHNDKLLASCVICKYHRPKKKSKFRVAMERLPISGMTIMEVNDTTRMRPDIRVMEFKDTARTDDLDKISILGDIVTVKAGMPLVILHELSSYVTDRIIKMMGVDGWIEKEIDLIKEKAGAFGGVYVIFMYDDHPEVLGPIDKSFDYNRIVEHIMSDGAKTKELINRRYKYGLKLLRTLIDEIGPVNFISFTSSKKIGIANMRDIIEIQQETGSKFTMWFGNTYKAATSYAKNLYFNTYGKKLLMWSSAAYHQSISGMISAVAVNGYSTVAYLLPQDEYVVGYAARITTVSDAIGKTRTKFIYIYDEDAGPEHKRLACGSFRMYDHRNSVGILTDDAPPGHGIYRLADDKDELIPHGTYIIGLKKSQEELLAQV